MKKEESQEIHIDVDRLLFIANTGVNRAAVFMGLGLNAAHNPNFNSYRLSDLPIDTSSIAPDFVPREAPPETIDAYKQEFSIWITGCGLREVLEHFGLMLDEMHRYCLLIAQCRHPKLLDGHPEKLHRDFHSKPSISAKLNLLEKRFGIVTPYATEISALYRLRNSLTHGLGFVRERDVDEKKLLTLRWQALLVVAKGVDTGDCQPLKNLIGVTTQEEMVIKATFSPRELTLHEGQKVELTEADLWEICLFFRAHCISSVIESFLSFAKSLGIPIQDSAIIS